MTHEYGFSTHIWTQKIFLKFFVLLLTLVTPHLAVAQNDDELLENFFRDNEGASESDAQLFLENLEQWKDKPLNLNTVSKEELLSTLLLNEIQVENFILYRDRMGPFLNEYELQAIPNWELSDIRRILPYAKIKSGLDARNSQLQRGFWQGDNELFLRWAQPSPPNYDPEDVEGQPNAWAVRYRHNYDNRLRFGFTAENDAGEAFFNGSNKHGFDFYSAHLFAQNINRRIKTVALGDYSARMGQGLLLQTGFAPGKSAETVSVARGGRKLNAYGAFGEAFFFRGAATTLSFGKHLDVTMLYSRRRRDANILKPDTTDGEFADQLFSSLQTSGLHRTNAEIEDEKKLGEQVGGLSATWTGKHGQISANALHIHYDQAWDPGNLAYRRYAFRGRNLTGMSLDYQYRWRNLFMFGETARSDNGGIAAVNGLLFSADRHVTLTAVHRSLGKAYQSIYGNPFAEVSGASNEQGLYLGADIRWVRRVQINLYADVWRHPWLRFGVDAPSNGREFLARVLWTKSRNFSVYALWQTETKQRNDELSRPFGLVDAQRNRFRLHAIYKIIKPVELRSRIEWTTYGIGNQSNSRGFVAYQEAVIKPLSSPASLAFRYAVFDTEDYDSRVYAFESDLFAAVSIPAFAGRGTRWYLNVHYRVNKWLKLDARLEETNTLQAATDSGTTGKERIWKLQARIKM
ncbi:MAG: hypothetical protein J0M29_06090 [Chitinophagales bacterium]|nr:hypothetical protein [Chitinophagales bacterium]